MLRTTEQKIFIFEAYFRQKFIHAAQLQFKERFGCREFPVHSMIYRWVNKFRTLGTVHNLIRKDTNRQSHSGRPNHQGHHTTLLLSKTLLSTTRGRQRAVCDNQHRAICPGAWQVLDSTWSTETNPAGTTGGSSSGSSRMVPPSHLQGVIGMATAAFPWSTDQLQVWPAVVAAFTGLEPPGFYLRGYLKDRVYGNNPQSILDLKAAITAAIRAIPREECGRVIENFSRRIQMCLQRRGISFGAHFLSACETKSFCSTDLKLWWCLLHRLYLVWLKVFVNLNKFWKLFDFWWWPFFVSPCK